MLVLQEGIHREIADGRSVAVPSIPVSSKHPSRRSKNEFYRYYAGYPLDFAQWALGKLKLPSGGSVIDPWSGSGTTAVACAGLRVFCQGYDINPVMVHLSRARLASNADFHKAEALISATEKLVARTQSIDMRVVGSAFRDLPGSKDNAHSVAIAALFPYARELLGACRTKNPTWYKKGAAFEGLTISADELFASWRILLGKLLLWRNSNGDDGSFAISIDQGDSRKSLGRKDVFDGFMTSPPYLTRLDYVQATLPEFLLLQEFVAVPNMDKLRRSMLGSPLTSKRPVRSLQRLPADIGELLNRIAGHASKASATYYHRFFSTYFVDLQASIRNLANVLNDGASGCMVVQSSHYKEIEIDLAAAIVSLGREFGLHHYSTVEFDSCRSISTLNSRAHIQARKPKTESAVFFKKV